MPRSLKEKLPNKPKPKLRKNKANGYKFPEKLPPGEILTDNHKKKWIIGPSIGQGGFGEIYSASEAGSSSNANSYVVKIEPHENGPLFVEMHFYLKAAKADDVESWKKKEGVKCLGLPGFYGNGSHEYKQEKYRFLVIERYGRDLWSLFLENGRKFPPAAVYRCAVQILDVLQYIHSLGYVHLDIKGANLLLGQKKGTENNVFLLDFGLACKYNRKEYRRDPKKAHNGTIEYTCRDLHMGVPTRRGDLEILGYNLLQWLATSLPWEKDIHTPDKVYEKKRELMENVRQFIGKHYPQLPKVVTQYLEYVSELEHNQEPDYKYCKNLFLNELKTISTNGKLDFSINTDVAVGDTRTPKKSAVKRKSTAKENVPSDTSEEQDGEEDVSGLAKAKKSRKKASQSNEGGKPPAAKAKVAGPRKAKVKEANSKASWKDAPTVQASGLGRAGEYIKKGEVSSGGSGRAGEYVRKGEVSSGGSGRAGEYVGKTQLCSAPTRSSRSRPL